MDFHKEKKETRLQFYLKQAIDKHGGRAELAEHLNISQPYLSDLLSGKKKGERKLIDFAEKLGVSPLELMNGVTFVPQEDITREEKILLYTASEFMAKYVKDGMLVDIPPRGKGDENMTREAEERRVGIVIEDQTYKPAFMPGDIIIVDPDINPQPGDLCLVIIGEQLLIRRLAHQDRDETHFALPSDEFRQEVIKSSSPALMEIWGKAVHFRRKL